MCMVDNPPKEFHHLERSKPSERRGETQQTLYHGAQAQPSDFTCWSLLGQGWSEPAATSAVVQDEAVQAVLTMNQKHILFPCPGIFQPPSLPQNFPFLLTSPPPTYLPPLPPSPHFPLIPFPEHGRAPNLE